MKGREIHRCGCVCGWCELGISVPALDPKSSLAIALENVRERMAAAFKGTSRLTIRPKETMMADTALEARARDHLSRWGSPSQGAIGDSRVAMLVSFVSDQASEVERLLRAVLDAQTVSPYRGWNITKLGKVADEARALFGLPSIRDLNPDIAKMKDHAEANAEALRSLVPRGDPS